MVVIKLSIISIFSFSNSTTFRFFRSIYKDNISSVADNFVPHGIGVNYNAGIWHFPLISTEDMNFLVVDRKGSGENLIIENFDKEEIVLKY
ncbi:ureidoglycolate lyase [Pelagibacterales bacterium SAG-MED21]|nr:ureidoglycolate lyase [Pelagibacterales bacterium SAG-MED21]